MDSMKNTMGLLSKEERDVVSPISKRGPRGGASLGIENEDKLLGGGKKRVHRDLIQGGAW